MPRRSAVPPTAFTIELDDREPPSVRRRLDDTNLYDIKEHRLKTGDILFTVNGRRVAIERKTWADLFGSVRKRQPGSTLSHFAHQIRRLREEFDLALVMIEGSFMPTADGGIRLPDGRTVAKGVFYQADNALMSVQDMGIRVFHVLDPEKLGVRLWHAIKWADRRTHKFASN